MKGIDGAKAAPQSSTTIVIQQISIADELTELAKLKEHGIISEVEFVYPNEANLLKKIQR